MLTWRLLSPAWACKPTGALGTLAGMSTEKQRAPRDWREGRRLRALELHEQGWTGKATAEALGVTKGAVSQWLKRARNGGADALRTHPPPRPPPRLTVEQRAALPGLLAREAEAFGFLGEVWTSKRIARVIADEFHVRYHSDHVRRVLCAAGWSPRKPIRRATQRDEAAIERWFTKGCCPSGKEGSRGWPPGVPAYSATPRE